MTKVDYLKREIRKDIQDHDLTITRELLLTLIATNKTMKYYDNIDHKTIGLLTRAIKEIYQEEFHCDIELFSNI